MSLVEFFEEATAEQAREHAHRQEEARLAGDPARTVGGEATAGNDAMHMRMVRQRRAPRMQDQGHTDVRAEMLRVGGDGAQRLRSDLEQQVIDQRLVVVGDGTDRRRQGEHHMVVVQRQQVGLARLEPAPRGAGLALRAMPIATGVVGDLHLCASVAAQ